MTKFIVLIDEGYVDGCASLTHEDGEMGGEGWVEWSDPLPLALGVYAALDEETAIEEAAKRYGVSEDILYAYKLG